MTSRRVTVRWCAVDRPFVSLPMMYTTCAGSNAAQVAFGPSDPIVLALHALHLLWHPHLCGCLQRRPTFCVQLRSSRAPGRATTLHLHSPTSPRICHLACPRIHQLTTLSHDRHQQPRVLSSAQLSTTHSEMTACQTSALLGKSTVAWIAHMCAYEYGESSLVA